MIDPEDPLAVASRMADDVASSQGYVQTCGELGLEFEDVEYLSKQRALRMLLLMKGGEPLLNDVMTGGQVPPLSAEDDMLLECLAMMTVGGIVIGWTARGVNDVRKGNDNERNL